MYSLALINIMEQLIDILDTIIMLRETLLELHGPQNGAWNQPCKDNFGGPLVKAALQAPSLVWIDQFFTIDM